MAYPIRWIKGHLTYDSLPVAKITQYPDEPKDYKPFAEARVGITEEGLFVQLLSFESHPEPESCLKAVLYLQKDLPPVTITGYADGRFESSPISVKPHFSTGENLQGVFWGVDVCLPFSQIQSCFPDHLLRVGSSFSGNFYKTCNGKRPHAGRYVLEDTDLFPIVNY